MKTQKTAFFAVVLLAAALSTACGSLVKSFSSAAPLAPQTELAALLPASDVAVRINPKRLLNDSIPQMLAFAPEYAAQFEQQIKDSITKNKVDPRAFDEIVVGWTYKNGKPVDAKDVEFVALMRGTFDAAALLEASKNNGQNEFREETVNGKTVYVCDLCTSAKPDDADKTAAGGNSPNSLIRMDYKQATTAVAVTLLEANTAAFGSPARIRDLAAGKTAPLNPALVELLKRNPNHAINFATDGAFYDKIMTASERLALDAPKMREALASIDFDQNGLALQAVAVGATEADAQKIEDSFRQMQTSAKQMLGGSTGEMQQISARTVDNCRIARSANETQLDLKVPKDDFDKMVKGYLALLPMIVGGGPAAIAPPPSKE